jgi:hypothetical protein
MANLAKTTVVSSTSFQKETPLDKTTRIELASIRSVNSSGQTQPPQSPLGY